MFQTKSPVWPHTSPEKLWVPCGKIFAQNNIFFSILLNLSPHSAQECCHDSVFRLCAPLSTPIVFRILLLHWTKDSFFLFEKNSQIFETFSVLRQFQTSSLKSKISLFFSDFSRVKTPSCSSTFMCVFDVFPSACLCVHVLESRPSLVALCLRSVYTRGSKPWAGFWEEHARWGLYLPPCECVLCVWDREGI